MANSTSKIVSLNCVNCGSPITIDVDNIISYCPHCGSKLLIDSNALTRIIVARENTKSKQIEAQKQIEIRKIDAKQAADADRRDKITGLLWFILFPGGMMLTGILLFVFAYIVSKS